MPKTIHSRKHKLLLELLRQLRLSRRLRQSDLAKLVGSSQATVSNVERGERRLDVIELMEWLEAMGANVSPFLETLEMEYCRLRTRGVARNRFANRADGRKSDSR